MGNLIWLIRQHLFRYRRALILGTAGLVAIGVLYGQYRLFFYQANVRLDYGKPTCINDYSLFPKAIMVSGDRTYSLKREGLIKIAGHSVLSKKVCVTVNGAPKQATTSHLKFGYGYNHLLSKQITIKAPAYPVLRAEALHADTISPKEPVTLYLSQPDTTFSYYLQVNDKRQQCAAKGTTLRCDVAKLDLDQGTKYEVSVHRYFKQLAVNEMVQKLVTTTNPVVITTTTNIPANNIIYDTPSSFKLMFNKPVNSVEVGLSAIGEKEVRTRVATTVELKNTEVTITPDKPLARNTRFEIVVNDAVGEDRGYLEQPYVHGFLVSGGPKVTGVNIGKTTVDPNAAIVVGFDQNLAADQDLAKNISFKVNGAVSPAAYRIEGNKLIITPAASMGRCTPFSITLTNDFRSNYGIAGNSGWSYNSRTTCYIVNTIGYSAKGRPIRAWLFGGGSSRVIYVGNMHGNEKGTKYLMDAWVNELEVHPEKIPAHRTIIVIPTINPDGFASDSRTNANGVDLNRNFPANNWKADVTMPGGNLVKNGGGTNSLSEPESAAIAAFIKSQGPDLVLTYHSVASIVSGNGSGNSITQAGTYARLSGYRNLPVAETSTTFQYDTTGAMEDWLYDKESTPALLIELGSHTSSQWSRNLPAMWAMVNM